MTEQEFLRRSFRAFQHIQFKSDRIKNPDGGFGVVIDCQIIEINFDQRLFKIQILPNDWWHEEEFYARCEACFIPPKKPNPVLSVVGKPHEKKRRLPIPENPWP